MPKTYPPHDPCKLTACSNHQCSLMTRTWWLSRKITPSNAKLSIYRREAISLAISAKISKVVIVQSLVAVAQQRSLLPVTLVHPSAPIFPKQLIKVDARRTSRSSGPSTDIVIVHGHCSCCRVGTAHTHLEVHVLHSKIRLLTMQRISWHCTKHLRSQIIIGRAGSRRYIICTRIHRILLLDEMSVFKRGHGLIGIRERVC